MKSGQQFAAEGKRYAAIRLSENSTLLHKEKSAMTTQKDTWTIAGREFTSRLMVGTGKYASFQQTAEALEASGAEIITVAVRRVNLDRSKESLLD